METGKCLRHLCDALYHHVTSSQLRGIGRGSYSYKWNALLAVYDNKAYTFRAGKSEWASKTSSAGKWLALSSACMTDGCVLLTGGHRISSSRQCWKLTLPTMK